MGRSSNGAAGERLSCRRSNTSSSLLGDGTDFYLTLNKRSTPAAAMFFGNGCHSVTPMLVGPIACRTRTSPDGSPLPFHLLPRFTDRMDHVRKSLMASGLSSPLKRKAGSCGVCRLGFNSECDLQSNLRQMDNLRRQNAQAASHYSGTKRAKRLKALDAPDTKIGTSQPVAMETISQILPPPGSKPSGADATSGEPGLSNFSSEVATSSNAASEALKTPLDDPSPPSLRTPDKEAQREGELDVTEEKETEEEKAERLLYCSLCKVAVNSTSQLQAHNSGTKHKTMLAARSGDGAIKSFPRSGIKAKLAPPAESATGLHNKTFHCEICDVHVNSETQLKQHISSRRHKDRAAGKPAKPKFSPYTPGQRQQVFQAIHLALQKNPDRSKPLASSLLHRPLSVAAAVMASLPSFPLRPGSTSGPALYQNQPLPHALLHPAPGPICSAHTPVLFSPY